MSGRRYHRATDPTAAHVPRGPGPRRPTVRGLATSAVPSPAWGERAPTYLAEQSVASRHPSGERCRVILVEPTGPRAFGRNPLAGSGPRGRPAPGGVVVGTSSRLRAEPIRAQCPETVQTPRRPPDGGHFSVGTLPGCPCADRPGMDGRSPARVDRGGSLRKPRNARCSTPPCLLG